ncbi:unnamed protein product [Rotaria magnacalcarata]|uniref:Integrase catalytic domain-containing protein n=1 Tax=Rotaria magnacalcarata TaxID=392030 RepID=A0A820HCY9_9BILA|nr:unnamed protein product [Rotaria magnacalcarata]CAF4290984.1 unnamed protein product [Rotaria magnacalcarata]
MHNTLEAFKAGGSIQHLKLDNAAEFRSKTFKQYFESKGTKLHYGASNYSESNGLVERINMTIKQKICLKTNDSDRYWDVYLDEARNSYNDEYHSELGKQSPNQAFRKYFNEKNEKFALSMYTDAIDSLNKKRSEYFQMGNLVLKKIKRQGNRKEYSLDPKYLGPFTIIDIAPNKTNFTLQSIEDKSKPKKTIQTYRAHYEQIKKWKQPGAELTNNSVYMEKIGKYTPKYIWDMDIISDTNIPVQPNNELKDTENLSLTRDSSIQSIKNFSKDDSMDNIEGYIEQIEYIPNHKTKQKKLTKTTGYVKYIKPQTYGTIMNSAIFIEHNNSYSDETTSSGNCSIDKKKLDKEKIIHSPYNTRSKARKN